MKKLLKESWTVRGIGLLAVEALLAGYSIQYGFLEPIVLALGIFLTGAGLRRALP